jgi:hypothetical protein
MNQQNILTQKTIFPSGYAGSTLMTTKDIAKKYVALRKT